MGTPLQCKKLLDKKKNTFFSVWPFATTAFIAQLDYFLTIISKVSNNSFLSNFEFAIRTAFKVLVLKYLGMTSIEVGEFYAREL